MKAIRGATTVSEDTPKQIKEGVKELLNEIMKVNNLDWGPITLQRRRGRQAFRLARSILHWNPKSRGRLKTVSALCCSLKAKNSPNTFT